MCERVNSRGYIQQVMTPEQLKELEDWLLLRKQQLENEPNRGLLPTTQGSGWHCPNCGGAHGPHIATCPEPPRGGSLRERLKHA